MREIICKRPNGFEVHKRKIDITALLINYTTDVQCTSSSHNMALKHPCFSSFIFQTYHYKVNIL